MLIKQVEIADGTFMNYREGTTDLNAIIEVHQRKEYQNKKLGFIFDTEHVEGKLWLDLGANIGAFSRLIKMYGGRVISFEPEPENFEILCTNVQQKGGEDLLMMSAVTTSDDSKINFYTASKETDKYRYTSIPNSRPVGTFNNTNISQLMEHDFDGIKMDIEGAEHDIIDSESIPECNLLVMEYHFSKDKNMRNFHRRMEILKSKFSIVHYQPFLNKYDLDKPYPIAMDKIIHCVK